MVRTHQEEQQQLAEDHEGRMALLVQGIKAAGLSNVLYYATSDIQPKRRTLSTPEDDATVTAYKSDAEDEKPITKRENMRLLQRQEWLEHELKRMESCSESPKPKMRVWLTCLRAARKTNFP